MPNYDFCIRVDQLLTSTRLQKLNMWRRTQFGPKDHLHQDPATLGDGTSWCIRYVTGSRFHSKFRNPDAHPMALILPFVTFAGFKISYLSCSRLWGRKPVWFLKFLEKQSLTNCKNASVSRKQCFDSLFALHVRIQIWMRIRIQPFFLYPARNCIFLLQLPSC